MTAINRGFFISAIGVAAACFTFLPAHFARFNGITDSGILSFNGDPRWIGLGAILISIVLASASQLLTEYFTETNRRPGPRHRPELGHRGGLRHLVRRVDRH
jgi:K(+)-stimulated pyrophosphate-energized sodium pump